MSSAMATPYGTNITLTNTAITTSDLIYTTGSTFTIGQEYEIGCAKIHIVHLEDGTVKRKKTVTFKPENLLAFKEAYPDDVIILTESDFAEVILKWS